MTYKHGTCILTINVIVAGGGGGGGGGSGPS